VLQRRHLCLWCGDPFTGRRDSKFCSRKCRQAAFRCRRRQTTQIRTNRPLRLAYADPPYPGMSIMYKDEPDYAGEVDHKALIERLCSEFDGWALSTSGKRAGVFVKVLALCPPESRVCPWVKPIGVSKKTRGLHNTWEPLIVYPARNLEPGFRDWLEAQPARYGGELIGRKPIEFCVWMFRCLGALPGDELFDLYPGTGIVLKAFRHWSDKR
jgi:hypothetical protein